MSDNVLVLPINAPNPPPDHVFIRDTRRLKYFKKPNVDPNAMDVQQIANVEEQDLENWEDIFVGQMQKMNINGGKRKSKKSRKSRKSRRVKRKSRKH